VRLLAWSTIDSAYCPGHFLSHQSQHLALEQVGKFHEDLVSILAQIITDNQLSFSFRFDDVKISLIGVIAKVKSRPWVDDIPQQQIEIKVLIVLKASCRAGVSLYILSNKS
jgi:hypothetical protein